MEAVALIVPPCFLAEHASSAVAAGLHVYMAKPVGVDVFGCLRVASAGKEATKNKRVFLVDYQLPIHPANIEVAERVRKEGLGKLSKVSTVCVAGGATTRPRRRPSRAACRAWFGTMTLPLAAVYIVSYDIHALDAAIWILGQRPVAAMGDSASAAPTRMATATTSTRSSMNMPTAFCTSIRGRALPNGAAADISCKLFGQTWNAVLDYYHQASFHRRGEKPLTIDLSSINTNTLGATRNVASFYQDVTAGRFENPTVQRAVDGCLTCILGREAGFRHGRLTMEELLKENRRVEVDRSGLKD